jgi:hypothetical protein
MSTIPQSEIKDARARLKRDNAKWPKVLKRVPVEEWPPMKRGSNGAILIGVWRSNRFLVQVFVEGNLRRLTINRAEIRNDGYWMDGITWDEMQRLKRECGYGDVDAVEIFPADKDLVDVQCMRHLWIMEGDLPFKWKQRKPEAT